MFKLTGSKIQITRGDTAHLTVQATRGKEKEPYEIGLEDKLTLTVRKSAKSSDILLQKMAAGVDTFYFEPEDTSGMKFGLYVYDIQLNTSDGGVHTIVAPAKFEVLEEVTY